MRKVVLLVLIPLTMACQRSFIEKDAIIDNMKRVADYELAHPSCHYSVDDEYNYPSGWIPATFYVSLIPLYEATGDVKYLNKVKEWGNSTQWECAPRFRHADDMACGQVYLDLYRHEKEDVYLLPLVNRMDSLIGSMKPGREDWHWCDALFMAPPVYMMAGSILEKDYYQDYVDQMYWDVFEFLFDAEDSLFYRDEHFFTQKSPNGEKLFWGRGNGWVLGGLARLIPYVNDETSKLKYIELFCTMAQRIVELQQEDGLWRSNLLDVNHFPQKETSGSGFYIYALAWGINNGILDAKEYRSAVINGWNAMCECIDEESGMLGWVQPIGAAPGDTKATTTKSYGAGAFVLAGTEMLKLIEKDIKNK